MRGHSGGRRCGVLLLGFTMTERDRQAWANEQVALLGLEQSHPLHKFALQAAERGWPAWRIAQTLRLDESLIEKLGGPARTG